MSNARSDLSQPEVGQRFACPQNAGMPSQAGETACPTNPDSLAATSHSAHQMAPTRPTQNRASMASDQARAAVPREIVVDPLHENQEAIFEFHQVHQVDENPRKPG